MFQVLAYTRGEKIPQDYSVATLAQAQHPDHRASVKQACSSAGLKEGQEVRLKNGLLRLIPGEYPFEVKCLYREGLEYRLISKPKLEYSGEPNSGKELISKEDCLIALAYAAEHDDVDDEVEELVQCAGKEILSTRMPFAGLGTILHVCIDWASINLLEKVLKGYPKSVDVYILDRDEDTALHYLPNDRGPKSYDECKRAACLLLGHHGVNANELLSKQNNYGRLTALSTALIEEKQDVCRALLDAAKEMEEKEEPATSTEAIISKAPHWLTLKVNDQSNTDDISSTALHLAVLQEYDDIVAKILAYPGAKGLNLTSLQDHKGNTPLHAVAKVGHHDICSMLLKYSMEINTAGANVRSENKAGKTPLLIASTHGYTEVCEKLLEYGAPLHMPDKRGKYALTNAFTKGHKSVVKRLLDACLPAVQNAESEAKSEPSVINTKSKHSLINEQFELGFTPLHVAVAISSGHHISNLLKAGAWVDSASDDGRTPLHVATQQHDKNAFFMLLEQKEELNVKDKKKGREGWINMKDIFGQTALHYIVRPPGESAKDQLSKSGVEEISNARDTESSKKEITDEGNMDGICKLVEVLLQNGAWVDVQDCHGETALHVAARRHEKVLQVLLESCDNFRSSFNNRDKWIAMCDFSGETALHEAARTGCLKSVQHLLNQTQSRADLLRVRDMENMTALDWAARKEDNETMIDEMIGNPEKTDKITKDFLMWNLKQHINPHYHKLLCKKYKVEENQTSLLQAAVEKEAVDIARELINRGANVPSLEYNHRRWLAQNLGKKASDQPTSEDTLDRKALVQGVANLLLNPYTETPLTIGIFGSWGTGKSSFMLQVEEAMLHMAVKETFRKNPYTLLHDKESSVLKFSRIGAILRCKVVKALKQRMSMEDKYNQGNQSFARKSFPSADQMTLKDGNKSTWGKALLAKLINPPKKNLPSADIENHVENLKDEDDIITRFPMELQSKYRQLFKDLALSDRSKLILRATNLILGSCGISAVIGVDKGMVHRAITKEFLKDIDDKELDIWAEDTDNKAAPDLKEKGLQVVVENVDKKTIQEKKASQKVESNKKAGNDDKLPYTRDLADKYLQKIIQLPIEMPYPSRKHVEHFLEGQVGKLQKGKDKIQEEKDEGNIAQSQADGTENGTSGPIVFRLLLANYTPMEKDMLKELSQLTTNERAFPREWKRFLNYHRLAWTILSQDHDMKSNEFKGWQRKLILWIFICWNWRDQMDVIFEKWHDIIPKMSKLQARMHLQEKVELCDIIHTYMKSKGWSTKEDVNQNRGKQDCEKAPKAWIDLYKKLKDEYDIPVHFIEKFQQFRFYCKLNHLEIDI